MTKFLTAMLAVIAASLFASAPATARPAWTCDGPAFVCSGKGKSAKKSYAKKSYASKAQRKTKVSKTYKGGGSSGMASYYWQGTRTASGVRFNPNGLTAAHRTLPFGTRVRVTNHNNGRSVVVTINDRGPFIKGRVIDLSRGAAKVVGMTGSGVARVSYSVVGRG